MNNSIDEKNKLKFIITHKNNEISINCHIIFAKVNKDSKVLNKNYDVKDLLEFSVDFCEQRNIKLRRRVKKNSIDNYKNIYTFDDADKIIRNYDILYRTHHKKNKKSKKDKFCLQKIAMGGAVFAIVGAIGFGICTSNKTKGKHENTNTNKTNSSIETEIKDKNYIKNNFLDITNADDEMIKKTVFSDIKISLPNNEEIQKKRDEMIKLEEKKKKEENKENEISTEIMDKNMEFKSNNQNVEIFSFNYDNQEASENVIRSNNYINYYIKYGKQYGIDPKLLMAIVSQESSGIHEGFIDEPAVGAMQIQNVWNGESVTAYNFNTHSYETEHIDWYSLDDLDLNIKTGTMIFASYLEQLDYDLPKTIAGYNIGIGAIKSMGDSWQDQIQYYTSGDNKYYKKVLSFLPDGQEIKVMKPNGEEKTFIIDNEKVSTYKGSY